MRKMNPKSLENLQHEGRPLLHGEPKRTREVSVTQTGWDGAKQLAQSVGANSVSELIERLGRGGYSLTEIQPTPSREQ
jgi:hypothetical protein